MAEPVDYPTPELLEKIAEVATIFKDFQRTAAPYKLNSTTINIRDMMTPETFELPMDWDQPGSQLYRRIISVFGLTPTIIRKLHLERHFSEEDVDKHIDHFNGMEAPTPSSSPPLRTHSGVGSTLRGLWPKLYASTCLSRG